jgi:protein-S-isoprenylcysteine O-methyltransferase Ste14
MTEKDYCLIGYIGLLLVGRFISQKQRKSEKLAGQARKIIHDPTAIIMIFGVIIAFAVPLIEVNVRKLFEISWLALISGVIIIVAGWLLIYSANQTIAENWSPSIEKTETQQLITQGVYGVIRHPLYLSGLLILAGTNIYFLNQWSWFTVILAFVVVLYRIPIEERHLEERFGNRYLVYQQKTKSLFPYIW